jgi:hypothetical protein
VLGRRRLLDGLRGARRAAALRGGGETLDAAASTTSSDLSSGASAGTATRTRSPSRLAPVLLTCLALTWLNPHVPRHGVPVGFDRRDARRDPLGVRRGAVLASFMWFFALALGARSLGRWLATSRVADPRRHHRRRDARDRSESRPAALPALARTAQPSICLLRAATRARIVSADAR